jgi:hypothetical protein
MQKLYIVKIKFSFDNNKKIKNFRSEEAQKLRFLKI